MMKRIDIDDAVKDVKLARSVDDALESHRVRLAEAYAEIDRLTAAFNASEATLKDCQAENDRLTAMLDELRGKQAEPELVWACPKSLKDGDYVWDKQTSRLSDADGDDWTRYTFEMLRDWTYPPVAGRWRITDGKAEYLGP